MNFYRDQLLLSMIVLSEFPIFYGALPKLNDEIEVGQKSYKLVQNSYKLVHQLVTNLPTLVEPSVHGMGAPQSDQGHARSIWEPPNPTSIFHFVSRLSRWCALSQRQMRPIRRSGPRYLVFFYFQMNQSHAKF